MTVTAAAPRRIFTGPPDDSCMVCGCSEATHIAARIVRACPVTADSLTTEQIQRWHADGGSYADALDASAEFRAIAGIYYPHPSPEQAAAARALIAAELNR